MIMVVVDNIPTMTTASSKHGPSYCIPSCRAATEAVNRLYPRGRRDQHYARRRPSDCSRTSSSSNDDSDAIVPAFRNPFDTTSMWQHLDSCNSAEAFPTIEWVSSSEDDDDSSDSVEARPESPGSSVNVETTSPQVASTIYPLKRCTAFQDCLSEMGKKGSAASPFTIGRPSGLVGASSRFRFASETPASTPSRRRRAVHRLPSAGFSNSSTTRTKGSPEPRALFLL